MRRSSLASNRIDASNDTNEADTSDAVQKLTLQPLNNDWMTTDDAGLVAGYKEYKLTLTPTQ